MAENRKIVMKDTDVLGLLREATFGVAPASSTYLAVKGIVQEWSFTPNDDRRAHNQSGDRYMASQQSWGRRSGTGRLSYKLANDFTSGDAATTSLLSIALGSATLGLETVSGKVFTRGTQYIAFDGGTTELGVGEVLTGGTSTATAVIKDLILVSGTWGGNNAAGYLILTKISGVFQNNETITSSAAGPGSATSDGSQKTIGSQMESFSFWLRQTNLPSDATHDHVLTGCVIKTITLRGSENGDTELDIDYKFADWVEFAPYGSSLPSTPYTAGNGFFNWTSSDGAITFARAGSEQRIKTFDIMFDNGELHDVPKAGQRMAAEFVAGMFKVTGNLEFFTNDTELDTIWNTNPGNRKELDYDGQSTNFTVGMVVTGGTSGATAIIESDSDDGASGTLTLVSIKGAFQNSEALTDEGSGDGNADGVLQDAGKTLAYDGQTADFNVGSTLSGQTSGATAIIVEDADAGNAGTLKLKRIQGQFEDNEVLVDDGAVPAEAACNGTLTDTASLDFELTLSKDGAGQYIKIDCYNAYPTGSRSFTYNPQEDATWMISYPFEVFMNGNVFVDLLG